MSKFDLMLGITPEPEPKKPRKKRSKKQVYSDAYDDDSFQDRRSDLRSERDAGRRSQMLEAAARNAARLSAAREQRRELREQRRSNREIMSQRRREQLERLRAELLELDESLTSPIRRHRWYVMIPVSIPVRGVTRIEIPLTPAILAHHWGRDRIWIEFEEPVQMMAGMRLTLIGRTRARTRYIISEVRRSGRIIIERNNS